MRQEEERRNREDEERRQKEQRWKDMQDQLDKEVSFIRRARHPGNKSYQEEDLKQSNKKLEQKTSDHNNVYFRGRRRS